MFGVYLHRPKTPANIGSALRAVSCFGGSIAMVSRRHPNERQGRLLHAPTDTHKTVRKIPVMIVDDLIVPDGFVPVAVELTDDAVDLRTFKHPRQALYIFGPEDGTLGEKVLGRCAHVVKIPMDLCMNLAATVNVVLYDRLAKVGA